MIAQALACDHPIETKGTEHYQMKSPLPARTRERDVAHARHRQQPRPCPPVSEGRYRCAELPMPIERRMEPPPELA